MCACVRADGLPPGLRAGVPARLRMLHPSPVSLGDASEARRSCTLCCPPTPALLLLLPQIWSLMNLAFASHEIISDYTTAAFMWFEGGCARNSTWPGGRAPPAGAAGCRRGARSLHQLSTALCRPPARPSIQAASSARAPWEWTTAWIGTPMACRRPRRRRPAPRPRCRTLRRPCHTSRARPWPRPPPCLRRYRRPSGSSQRLAARRPPAAAAAVAVAAPSAAQAVLPSSVGFWHSV